MSQIGKIISLLFLSTIMVFLCIVLSNALFDVLLARLMSSFIDILPANAPIWNNLAPIINQAKLIIAFILAILVILAIAEVSS